MEILPKIIVSFSKLSLTNHIEEGAKGFSIYGGEFADGSFDIKHTEPGLVGMCKRNGVDHCIGNMSNERGLVLTPGVKGGETLTARV